jgi:serine/threonine protein kinase
MEHGNINEFVKRGNRDNIFKLVSDWAKSRRDRYDRFIQLMDAASGLEYMHNLHMVHGDLKGVCCSPNDQTNTHDVDQANILINRSRHACLADFGLSTVVSIERRAAANASLVSVASKASLMSFTTGGTTRWMSPELLDPDRFGLPDDRPTKQSDCYALGMVIYEVRVDATVPALVMARIVYAPRFFAEKPLIGTSRMEGR